MRIRSVRVVNAHPAHRVTETLFDGETDLGVKRINCMHDGQSISPFATPVRMTGLTGTPRNIVKAHYSPAFNCIFAVGNSGALYLYDPARDLYFSNVGATGCDAFFIDEINGQHYATHIFSGYDRVRYMDGEIANGTAHLSFMTGATFAGRFFGVPADDGYKICWSGGDCTNWNAGVGESGYMLLPPEGGKILRLVSYGDRLVAVREKGLTVVRAACEPQHIRVEASADYLTADGIIADTVAKCNGGIYFCTASGVFVYDGKTVRGAQVPAGDRIKDFVCAVGSGKYYYLKCTSPLMGTGYVYCFDTERHVGCFINFVPGCMVAAADGVYAFSDAQVARLDRSGGALNWTSGRINFGKPGVKGLVSVDMRFDGELTLIIRSDTYAREVPCAKNIKILMTGDNFEFNVRGTGRLISLTATAEVKGAD